MSPPAGSGGERPRAPWWLLPYGALVAFVGSLAGVGGGLFVTPVLQFALGEPLKSAAATALVLVVATTGSATAAELLQEHPQLAPEVVLPLVAGVLAGAQAGFAVAQRIRVRPLRVLFVLFLAVAAARVFLGAAPSEPSGAALAVGWTDALAAGLVGLCGGFVAPLLGIGGGLMMVPGLLLVLPELGFAGARASSLAAGTVAAARSLMLHARAGRVRWHYGLPLAAGAVVGGWLGVETVHVPGLRDVGRPIIGAILVFVALRFLRDLLRPPASDHDEP